MTATTMERTATISVAEETVATVEEEVAMEGTIREVVGVAEGTEGPPLGPPCRGVSAIRRGPTRKTFGSRSR